MYKTCPHCQQHCVLDMKACGRCGHQFRTQFAPPDQTMAFRFTTKTPSSACLLRRALPKTSLLSAARTSLIRMVCSGSGSSRLRLFPFLPGLPRLCFGHDPVSRAFATFAAGSLSRSLVLPPGWYACAFRFVNALTGQMTELVALGVVQVV